MGKIKINDRDLYLMLFDDEMKKVYEVKLAKHRYNYFYPAIFKKFLSLTVYVSFL